MKKREARRQENLYPAPPAPVALCGLGGFYRIGGLQRVHKLSMNRKLRSWAGDRSTRRWGHFVEKIPL